MFSWWCDAETSLGEKDKYQINLSFVFLMGGGGVDSIHLLKELFSQPKLDIYRGV